MWTSSREDCGFAETKTAAVAIAYSDLHPEECTHINTETGVAAVCCADAVRTCDDGAPCHPKASLFTCEELGKLAMLSKIPSKIAKFHLQIVENRLEFQSKILPRRIDPSL